MAERRTIESWGSHLNIEGEPLDISEAMLLHLGHLNARLSLMIEHLEDMRMRLTRLELVVRTLVPNYDERARMAPMLPEREVS